MKKQKILLITSAIAILSGSIAVAQVAETAATNTPEEKAAAFDPESLSDEDQQLFGKFQEWYGYLSDNEDRKRCRKGRKHKKHKHGHDHGHDDHHDHDDDDDDHRHDHDGSLSGNSAAEPSSAG
ncbi:hypothetical protein [Kiloniella sp. b19]|uniref:hypothetical protein n=1 Tax=Kiloniella sp. GXU_MW_B19 TaxID=3141326 RepID=UPI0031D54B6D